MASPPFNSVGFPLSLNSIQSQGGCTWAAWHKLRGAKAASARVKLPSQGAREREPAPDKEIKPASEQEEGIVREREKEGEVRGRKRASERDRDSESGGKRGRETEGEKERAQRHACGRAR